MSQLPFRENLEQFNNPEEVRRRLAAGKYRAPHDAIAQEYLDSIDRENAAKFSERTEERENESISIAKAACAAATSAAISADLAARHASHAKYISIGIATVGTIISIIALLKK